MKLSMCAASQSHKCYESECQLSKSGMIATVIPNLLGLLTGKPEMIHTWIKVSVCLGGIEGECCTAGVAKAQVFGELSSNFAGRAT